MKLCFGWYKNTIDVCGIHDSETNTMKKVFAIHDVLSDVMDGNGNKRTIPLPTLKPLRTTMFDIRNDGSVVFHDIAFDDLSDIQMEKFFETDAPAYLKHIQKQYSGIVSEYHFTEEQSKIIQKPQQKIII